MRRYVLHSGQHFEVNRICTIPFLISCLFTVVKEFFIQAPHDWRWLKSFTCEYLMRIIPITEIQWLHYTWLPCNWSLVMTGRHNWVQCIFWMRTSSLEYILWEGASNLRLAELMDDLRIAELENRARTEQVLDTGRWQEDGF